MFGTIRQKETRRLRINHFLRGRLDASVGNDDQHLSRKAQAQDRKSSHLDTATNVESKPNRVGQRSTIERRPQYL